MGRRISVPLHFCANLRAQESLEWCGCTLPEETRTAQSSKRRKCRPTAMALHRSGGQGQERIGFYILGTLVQQELPLSLWFLLLWFDSSLFLQGFDSSLCGFRQEDRAAAWATSRNLEDGMAGVNWGIETPKVLQEGRMCPGQCCHSLCPSQHPSQSSELASTLSWVARGGLHSPFLGKLQLSPGRPLSFQTETPWYQPDAGHSLTPACMDATLCWGNSTASVTWDITAQSTLKPYGGAGSECSLQHFIKEMFLGSWGWCSGLQLQCNLSIIKRQKITNGAVSTATQWPKTNSCSGNGVCESRGWDSSPFSVK